jgi:hypothetical protein
MPSMFIILHIIKYICINLPSIRNGMTNAADTYIGTDEKLMLLLISCPISYSVDSGLWDSKMFGY